MSSIAIAVMLLGQPGDPFPGSDPTSPRTEAVMAAVFKDMVRDVPGLSGPYDGLVFCLRAPEETDPPATMLRQLTTENSSIRARSA